MKPILHTIEVGGSPHGLSQAKRWLGCPKQAAYQAKNQEFKPLTWSGANVGFVIHALYEMYFKGILHDQDVHLGVVLQKKEEDGVILQHSDLMEERVWVEAVRCFTWYRENFPQPDFFGEVHHVEYGISSCQEDCCEGYTIEPSIADLIGLDPFSCRLDLVTKLGKRQITRMKNNIEIDGAVECLQPGYWIVDHKNYSREESGMLDKTLWNHQYTSQQIAFNAAHPKTPVQGVIQNTLFRRSKNIGNRLTIVPPPNKHRLLSLKAFTEHIRFIKEHRGEVAVPSVNNCHSFWGTCELLKNGNCRGY